MKGYQNPNTPSTLGMGGCWITPIKIAVKAALCTNTIAIAV